ncbi:hypothetical protein B0H14DRAFT_2736996 [Mycena olivaceomarginata]|nr:hypothetical protein B0H14DRAFT_2736996 [Mycena olivaceomarginata]
MDTLNSPIYDLQLVSVRTSAGMVTALYRLVWKSPWSAVKALYLWARYSNLFRTQANVDPATCHTVTSFLRIFAVVGTVITELILTIRTYALYERSSTLLAFLTAVWFAIGGVNIWALIRWTGSLAPVEGSPPGSCNLDNPTNIGVVIYASLLVGETVVFLLTVWRGLRTFWLSRSIYRHSQLVTTFTGTGLILVVDVSLEIQAPPGLKFTADSSLRVMQSVLACHLVLHARAVGAQDAFGEDTDVVLDTLSTS